MNTTTENPAETEATATATGNCVRWPHNPPHCGCPAAAPAPTDV